ncbi:hypothetical protein WOLCODRAFT_159423 [Wolfiporia cocos MD-104 SS10]|uniref:Uncharacterized protein n=1 Tax=Wolfiporia cocos (strain MD-104) TaxID=742152 RepID=A0A2H3K9T4_WOLCO|nr:hypothetical protein WOLCODRAFT_159423 [Wolfiporia cocos MD-104 SS10]
MRTTDHIDVAVVLNVHGGFAPYDARAVCPSWGTRHITREVVEGAQDLWAEVVWELSVVSFRLEFLHADRALAPTHYATEDDILLREQLVTDIWLNNEEDAVLLRPNWEEQTPCDGLVHRDWQRRRHSVTGMVRVLASWPDSGHLYVPQENCTQSDFEHAEEIAIRFYATAYRRKFGRLPTFPLQCPASFFSYNVAACYVISVLFLQDVVMSIGHGVIEKAGGGSTSTLWGPDHKVDVTRGNLASSSRPSTHVRSDLARHTNRYRVAASHVRKAFLQKFGEQPYPAETDDEYQARLALCKTNRSRKKTPRFEAETEEQCRERLSSLDQQIYDWGRNHATSRSVKRLNVAMPHAAQIACSGNDPHACRPWDVFRELLKQGNYTRPDSPPPPAGGKAWTEWASALYETLTEEEKAELQELARKRHHEMMHTPAEMEAKLGAEEYERSRRAAGMETAIRLTAEHWEKQTGWVGTIMMTGLDENGYVTTYTHNTGSNHTNQDFEQTLREEAGLSLGRIRGTLFRFGQDIFDRK